MTSGLDRVEAPNGMPNTFAYIVLFLAPVAVFAFFSSFALQKALVISIVAGYLFLPEVASFDLPMVPSLNKESIPALFAALMCLLSGRSGRSGLGIQLGAVSASVGSKLRSSRGIGARDSASLVGRGDRLVSILVVLLLLTPFLTFVQNREPVIAGPMYIPGLRPYEALSASVAMLIMIVPFLLGRKFLGSPEAHRTLLKVLVGAGAVYAVLALVEVRLSPQLSNWVYGFFPHSWVQHVRGDGFRPIVFLEHSLALGLFLASSAIAALALSREAVGANMRNGRWLIGAGWVFFALVLSKNLGAIALAVLSAPLVLFASTRTVLLFAAVISSAVLIYPTLRGAGFFPVHTIEAAAAKVNEDRAGSMRFRFYHEERLLSRANEKPIAGWGRFGRSRVYDPDTGRDVSVTDGWWIIVIGTSGWVGYLAMFGLLTVPTFLIWRTGKLQEIERSSIGLIMVLAVALVYSIPNAFFGPVHWLIAGAIAGLYGRLSRAC